MFFGVRHLWNDYSCPMMKAWLKGEEQTIASGTGGPCTRRQTGESETSSPAPDLLSNPLECDLNWSANRVAHW